MPFLYFRLVPLAQWENTRLFGKKDDEETVGEEETDDEDVPASSASAE